MAPFLLALAGCFQQAGTALQEPIVTNQAVNVPPTDIPLPTEDNGSTTTISPADNGQGEVLATPTFNFIPSDSTATLETGNSDTGTTDTGDNGNPPVALTIISATLPPIATETPSTLPTVSGDQIVNAEGTPGASQFITPSGPLGPVTQVPIIVSTDAGDNSQSAATPFGLITPTAFNPVDTEGSCTHTVQSGDTLYRIAVKYGITVAQLREGNPNVAGDIIQPGDVLKIPGCNGDTSTANVEPTNEPSVPATALPDGSQTYVVKRGDTLYTIGLKFGVTADAIQKANNISNPNRINPGQELIIPPKSG